MHFFTHLLPFALSAAATGIMVPLYQYPNASATATYNNWGPVYSAVKAYPNVKWQIIVNPNSGPGNTTLQDTVFTGNVAKLNSYPNVLTIGYVESMHTHRPYGDVVADIKTYASWNNSKAGNISMHGIFFDDVSSWWDFNNHPETYKDNFTWYSNITNYAYSAFSSANTQVVLNTGDPANRTFFDISDTIVEYEDYYTNYSTKYTISNLTSRSNQLNWGSFIFHNATGLTSSTINSLVNTWDNAGLEYVYFTSDAQYKEINSTLLNALAYACANY